jgi:hypothetical protein
MPQSGVKSVAPLARAQQEREWFMAFKRRETPLSKEDARKQAEASLAEFLNKGGTVKQGPTVEATMFACPTCGHAGVAGFAPGKARKCPKCRSPLPES